MLVYITGAIAVALVFVALYAKSIFQPPKGGVVKVTWKDRHSLPTLWSRLPLILLGAMAKKEGRFYRGLTDFPETHIEVGTSEYACKRHCPLFILVASRF